MVLHDRCPQETLSLLALSNHNNTRPPQLKLVLVAGRANRLWLISQRKHIAKTRRDRSPWIESRKEKEGSGLSVVGTVTDNHAAIVEARRLDQVPSCAVRQSRN